MKKTLLSLSMMALATLAGAQTQVVEVEYLNGDMDNDQQITVSDATHLIDAYVKNRHTRQTMMVEIDNSWMNDYIAPWTEQTTRNANAIDSLESVVSRQEHWIDNTLIITADMAESIGELQDSIAMLNAVIKHLLNQPAAQLPSEITMPVEIPERYIDIDTVIQVPIEFETEVDVYIPEQMVETPSKTIRTPDKTIRTESQTLEVRGYDYGGVGMVTIPSQEIYVRGDNITIEGDVIALPSQSTTVPVSVRKYVNINFSIRKTIHGETVISKATITPSADVLPVNPETGVTR